MVFVSCYYQNTGTPDAWNLTDRQLDSISFYTTHHYTRNFNFLVKADSLELIVQHPTEYVNGLPVDTLAVHGGDRLVVADIVTMPADTLDSIWVKVARDQQSMGWIHEQTMLADVAPDAPISQFIDFFSDTHLLIVMGILVLAFAVFLCRRLLPLGAKMVHFNDIDSVYPMLLCLLVAASAVFYSTIQIFAPDSWRHYYYHPTLNPFSVPLHLGLFLLSVWAIVVAAIAAVDDIRHKLTTGDAFFYYLGLMGVCAVDYVVFSVSTLYYIGYPLLVAYVVVAMRHHISYHRAKLLCGRCGGVIPNKGVCPHCGAMNE
jgi:hypothetical protein